MHFVVSLALAAAAPASTDEIPAEFLEAARQMQKVTSVQAGLQQTKIVSMLRHPETSRGRLLFARPRRLKIDIEGPGGTTLLIDKDTMQIHYAALRRTERFDLRRDLRAKAVAEHLFLLLEADAKALATAYDAELLGTTPLGVRLVPRAPELRALISSIEVRFGAHGVVSWLEIRESNNDRTQWLFDPPTLNAQLEDDVFGLPN